MVITRRQHGTNRAVLGAHHTFIHRHSWNVIIDPATGPPQIYRPDGTLFTLEQHPPPLQQLLRPDRAAAA